MDKNKKQKENKKNRKIKALVMLSGGLDSRLALMLMKRQLKIDVESIFFALPFGVGCCDENCAFSFSQKQGVKLCIIDCTKGKNLQEYIKIIKNPRFGRGKSLNPCIDCRIFMLKKAKKFADNNGLDIIVTGEVINERPMSQHKKALDIIEKETKLKGRLLRPLSAKLLNKLDERFDNYLDYNKFLDIQGRQRKKQISLAKKFNITYPNPAGGCLLCDKNFSERLKQIFQHKIKLSKRKVELLKSGRHYFLEIDKKIYWIILGKNKEENEMLGKLMDKKKDKLITSKELELIGPSALIVDFNNKKSSKQLLKRVHNLIKKRSKKKLKWVI